MLIAEELFLIGFDEARGTPTLPGVRYGLAGAVIAEPVERGGAQVDDRSRLPVAGCPSTGDEPLDQAAARITRAGPPRRVRYWVTHPWALVPADQVPGHLVRRGVLRRKRRRILGILPITRPRPRPPRRRRSPRDAVLVGPPCACRDLPREDREQAWRRAMAVAKNPSALWLVFRAVYRAARASEGAC
ncbi:MAG: GPP34 family phosphoprotein [Egibacteraceae bacterium]